METSKFIEIFLKKGNKVIGTKINGWLVNYYQKLAGLTELIDYKCNFDRNGMCKVYIAKRDMCRTGRETMCCCHSCERTIGYLNTIPSEWGILTQYAELFDEETGFWRKGKGCILPRKLRSNTCLRYHCLDEELTSTQRLLMAALDHVDGVIGIYLKSHGHWDTQMGFLVYLEGKLKKEKG